MADGQVRVTEGAFGITVEINASVLFCAPARPSSAAMPWALRGGGAGGGAGGFPITVEGHTDTIPDRHRDVPRPTGSCRPVRASSVVRLFVKAAYGQRG